MRLFLSVTVFACASGLLAPAVLAVPQTMVEWDVSADGGSTWQPSVDVLPGATLVFRIRTSLINNVGAGRIPAGGVGGFNLQPNLSNWGSGDLVHPMAHEQSYEGSSHNPLPAIVPGPYPRPAGTFKGSGVVNGGNGRQAPFGVNGANGNGVVQPIVLGTDLRLGAPIINSWGISFTQFPAGLSAVYAWDGHTYYSPDLDETRVDPPASEIIAGLWEQYTAFAGSFFRPGVTNVVVFKYTVTLDSLDTSERVLVQSGLVEQGMLAYFPSAGVVPTSQTLGQNTIVTSAAVHVIPSPGTMIALSGLGLLSIRRRRS